MLFKGFANVCFFSFLWASIAPPADAIPSGPIIHLGYISVVGNTTTPNGTTNGSVAFFGGIPYAQPPLEQLRFRAPQPLDERPKVNPPVLDARNWGPPCIQQPAVVGVGNEGDFHLFIMF